MSVGDFFQDISAQPLLKFDHPFCMTGRAKMPSFAGKRQQNFVFTGMAFHPGKSIMKNSAIKILVNDFFYIGYPILLDSFIRTRINTDFADPQTPKIGHYNLFKA